MSWHDDAGQPNANNARTSTPGPTRFLEDNTLMTEPDAIEGELQDLHHSPAINDTDSSFRAMSLDSLAPRSSNPSYSNSRDFVLQGVARTNLIANSSNMQLDSLHELPNTPSSMQHERSINQDMSSSLPEDDGMRQLRERVHAIRDMALSSEERARKMHALMTQEYEAFKLAQQGPNIKRRPPSREKNMHNENPPSEGTNRSRADSLASESSDTVAEDFNVHPEDLIPTYHPLPQGARETIPDTHDLEDDELGWPFGCEHYLRNVKVQCTDCRRWYPCRFCHDQVEEHRLVRKNIRNMLCMACGYAQRANECCIQCGEDAASYYCDICKLWDNDSSKSIYHCPDCGICRIGEGLGKDYIHCKKCNVCISINHFQTHRCIEGATECDCPICGEYMFSSSSAIVAMRCGHYIHRACYDAYMRVSYKCPICNHSAVNMDIQWRKMDLCLESQPMPEQYRNTKVWIICNDCSVRSCVPFHWLGNKCRMCDGYNTNHIQLVNAPGDAPDERTNLEAEAQRAARAVETLHLNGVLPTDLAPDILPATTNDSGVLNIRSDTTQMTQSRSVTTSTDLHGETVHSNSQPTTFSPSSRNVSNINIAHMTDLAEEASRPMTETEDSEDETAFWGDGLRLSPPNILPVGWRSPRLFAASSDNAIEDDEDLPVEDSSTSAWPIRPSQWRLPSFSYAGPWASGNDGETPRAVPHEGNEGYHWPIDPRQWRLGPSRLFGTPTQATTLSQATATDVSSHSETGEGLRWPINPSQWRLSSPPFFRASTHAAATQTQPGEYNTESGTSGTAPETEGYGWPIHPSQWRFGSPPFFRSAQVQTAESPPQAAPAASAEDVDNASDTAARLPSRYSAWGSGLRQWALNSPKLFDSDSHASKDSLDAARSSGWQLPDPRHWTLPSPPAFLRRGSTILTGAGSASTIPTGEASTIDHKPRSGSTAAGSATDSGIGMSASQASAASPKSVWSLPTGWGVGGRSSSSREGMSQEGEDVNDSSDDDVEEDEDEGQDRDDDGTNEGDTSDEAEEDELDLIGHR